MQNTSIISKFIIVPLACQLISFSLMSSVLAAPTNALSSGHALPKDSVSNIDKLLGDYAEKERFSGQLLIARGKIRLLEKSYGYADWDTKKPFGESSIFKIGSLTKQFTAAGIMRLVDKNKVDPTDPVKKYIPELPAKISEREGKEVTLHHLLNHTSGIPRVDFGNKLGSKTMVFANVIRALESASLTSVPGTTYAYSSVGYVLLGEIIRRVSGTSYDQFLKKEFFIPLSMNNTGIFPSERQRGLTAKGHISTIFNLKPSREVLGNIIKSDYEQELGASGTLFSTINDLDNWLESLKNGSVLTSSSMKQMLTPGLENYGYGWKIRPVNGNPQHTLVWHNGAISPLGYYANASWNWSNYPNLKVIVLANMDISSVVYEVNKNIERILSEKEPLTSASELSGINVLAFFLYSKIHLLILGLLVVYTSMLKKYKTKISAINSGLSLIGVIFLCVSFSSDYWTLIFAGVATALLLFLVYRTRILPTTDRNPKKELTSTIVCVAVTVFCIKAGLELILG